MNKPTHIFTQTTDLNDDPHFLRGLSVELLERFEMRCSGFDCMVRVLASVELVAELLGCTPAQVQDYAESCCPEHGGITFEANHDNDLTPVLGDGS